MAEFYSNTPYSEMPVTDQTYEQAVQGDMPSLVSVLTHLAPILNHNLALFNNLTPQDREDILQTSSLKATQHIDSFISQEEYRIPSFIKWTVRITNNTAIDMLRRNSRRQEDLLDDTGWEPIESKIAEPDFADSLVDSLDNHNLIQEIMNNVELTDIQREAIELYYLDELSQKEVAERLHIPLNTVKTTIHHALIKIRDHACDQGLRPE